MKILSTIQKTTITIVLCLVTTMVYGQSDNLYLYTKTTSEAAVYSLDEISKITFSEKGIKIWNTSWPTEYVYSNVRVLTFKDQESSSLQSVEFTNNNNTDIDIAYDAMTKTLTASCGQVMKGVAVYNLNGVVIVSDMIPKRVFHLQLSGLSEGVYIVHVFGNGNTMSKKIVK